MNITDNLKKGTAELLLLVLLGEKDMYGYQLTQELALRSENLFILKEGSLYPILYRLQDKGYISCKEVIIQRRVRVYYHIEPLGVEYLNTIKNEYFLISKGIKNVLSKAGGR